MDRNDVFGTEDRGLLEHVATYFGKGEAIRLGIEILETSGGLYRLKGYASDTGLITA